MSFMTIDELMTGDAVKYRNGDMKIVLFGTEFGDIITSRDKKTYASLDEYNDDFTYNGDHQYDIVAVYKPKNKFRCLLDDYDNNYTLLWEAPNASHAEAVKMTVAQISNMLGFDVTIVG